MKGIQDTKTSNFSSLIRNGAKYIIPKFQRDYSWDSEQWDDLWMDIEKLLSGVNSEHYMGYLVLQLEGSKKQYIIDGQQRFTTITLIILAAIKSLQYLIDCGVEVEENRRRKENLTTTYIGKEDAVTLEYDNILELNRNNDDYYKEYIVKLGDLPIRNTRATEKLMKKSFEFFYGKLQRRFTSGVEYAKLIEAIVDNLFFTVITVNDDMNAFTVFETLNARGVQLSAADLLKNYLFSLVDDNSSHISRIESLERKWAKLTNNIMANKLPDYIRYYWNASHTTVRHNELFKSIRSEIKDDVAVFRLVDDLIVYSDMYMALQDQHDEMWENDSRITDNIELLNIFKLKQALSMLMTAYKNLGKDEFVRVLRDVIMLSFRYNIIGGKNPNDIERVYNEVAKKISSEGIYDKSILRKVYVEDQEFVSMFKSVTFVENARNNKIVKYILGKLNFSNGGLVDANIHNDNETIEHIIPQNPSEEWDFSDDDVDKFVYRLGNMCLLEKTLNRGLGNKVFSEKVDTFEKSSFVDTQSIAVIYSSWTKQDINARQSKMSNKAKGIWRIDF